MTEERRLVTGLFVDIVGFTTMGEERDPEEVRSIQRRYFDAVSREAERLGGSVEKYIGDAVVVVFGMPRAHDDDAERALRAALAIRDAVSAIGGLEIRIGVNTGEVVGGTADPHGGYLITGDAMNVAARLQQAAEPGSILVGPVTRRLTGSDFEYAPSASMAVKGKAIAVEAAELLGVRERPIRVHPGTAELVGRDGELAALESALDEAITGRGRVVALVGEAGIGKSRLALELRDRAAARGATVVWAAARSYAAQEPYFVVERLVRGLVEASTDRTLDGLLNGLEDPAATARWRVVLGGLVGERHEADESLTPQSRQRSLADALIAIVGARAARAPVVTVIDDLHWADRASRAIVDELVDAIAAMPVLLLATARPTVDLSWLARRHYRQVNLDSLLGADAQRLARALAGDRPLAPDVTARLLARSGGNPFFLEELVAGAMDGEGGRIRLPETVQEVLLARLDALPEDARRTLQLASVAGMEFSEDLLAVLAPPGEVSATLDLLRREDVLVRRPASHPHGGWVFRHPLIHEVAYRSVLLAHRRELHGKLARHLEAEGREEAIPAIAVHWRAGDDPQRAREALVRAAERAERLYATSEASTFYRDAAELTDGAERAALIERAAFQAYLSSDAHARAVELYREAIAGYEAAGLELRAHDARRNLSRVYWTAAQTQEAEQAINDAVVGLERLPPSPELAAAYSYRSQLLMLRPSSREGAAWAQRAIDLAERLGASHVLPHAYTNRGSCRIALGDPRGFDDLRLAIKLALEQDRPDDAARAYTNLSVHGDPIAWAPHDVIDRLLEEAIAYASEKMPGGTYDQALRVARAELRLMAGRWDEADQELARLRTGTEYNQLMLTSLRGLLAAHRGNGEAALAQLLPSLDDADRIRDLQMIVPRYTALLHAYRALGAFDEAAAIARRAADRVGSLRHGRLIAFFLFEATDVVRAARRAREDGAVAALVESLLPIAREGPDHVATAPTAFDGDVRRALVGAALHGLAHVADVMGVAGGDQLAGLAGGLPDEAAAATMLEEAGRPFDAARARLWAAERGLDVAEATSLEVFERLGARQHAEAVRALH